MAERRKAAKKPPKKIKVEVTFTEGYEQRFTTGVLKIYENRLRVENKQTAV